MRSCRYTRKYEPTSVRAHYTCVCTHAQLAGTGRRRRRAFSRRGTDFRPGGGRSGRRRCVGVRSCAPQALRVLARALQEDRLALARWRMRSATLVEASLDGRSACLWMQYCTNLYIRTLSVTCMLCMLMNVCAPLCLCASSRANVNACVSVWSSRIWSASLRPATSASRRPFLSVYDSGFTSHMPRLERKGVFVRPRAKVTLTPFAGRDARAAGDNQCSYEGTCASPRTLRIDTPTFAFLVVPRIFAEYLSTASSSV